MSEFSSGHDGSSIIDGTTMFFHSLVKKDFATVEDYLCPDCRLQDQFGEGHGVSGSDKCMKKIREVGDRLSTAGLVNMESVTLTRNLRQVRFMLHGKLGFIKISLGFAVEWSCGIISMLVIVKNPVDCEFLRDDTIAPSPSTDAAEIDNFNRSSEMVGTDSIDITSAVTAACIFKDDELTHIPQTECSVVIGKSEQEEVSTKDKGDKWYPGKYIQQRRKSTHTAPGKVLNSFWDLSKPADYDVVMESVGVNLQAPFLIPRPPAIPAALTVTVEAATHLKSRLVRLVTRPVNSYVSVSVAGRVRDTPIVSKNSSPDYGAACANGENIFIFELPNSVEFRREGCIEFTIKDKHLRDEDVLAEVVLPIISLKCKADHTAPTRLELPVELFSKHKPRLGKGFIKRRSESKDSQKKGEEAISHLIVSISKVDIMLWWVLEEIRARDKAREKVIAEEKFRKALEAETKITQERKQQDDYVSVASGKKFGVSVKAKKQNLKVLNTTVVLKDESEWKDGGICHGCKNKFSLTFRKHHCRACGEVFCDSCSAFQISDGSGEAVRACINCYNECIAEGDTQVRVSDLSSIARTSLATASADTDAKTRPLDLDYKIVDDEVEEDPGDMMAAIDLKENAVCDGDESERGSTLSESSEQDDEDMACVIC